MEPKHSAEKNHSQAAENKSFVVQNFPAETVYDSRLRGSAHQVLLFLLCKADVKTGELRIGSHWFAQHELVRAAKKLGISERTFRNVLRDQLIPLGYVKELERDLIYHTDNAGRNRKIPGSQHYVVFKASQKPHGQRIIRKAKPKSKPAKPDSPSGQNLPDVDNARPLDDSTSGKNLPDEENNLRPAKSTSGVDLPHKEYSKAPNPSAVGGYGFASSENKTNTNTGCSFHKGTTPENHSELPQVFVNPEIESEKQKLADKHKLFLRMDWKEKPNFNIEENFDSFRKQANALGMSWQEIQNAWKAILEEVFPSPKPAPPPPKPKPEPVPFADYGDKGAIWKRSRDFYRYATKFGWDSNRAAILRYLRDTFHVKTPDKLPCAEFRIAWRRIEQGPPKPN